MLALVAPLNVLLFALFVLYVRLLVLGLYFITRWVLMHMANRLFPEQEWEQPMPVEQTSNQTDSADEASRRCAL